MVFISVAFAILLQILKTESMCQLLYSPLQSKQCNLGNSCAISGLAGAPGFRVKSLHGGY